MKSAKQRLAALRRIYADVPADRLFDAICNDVKALKKVLRVERPQRKQARREKYIPKRHFHMLQEAIGETFPNAYTQLIVSMFMQLMMETGVRIALIEPVWN